MSFDFRRFVFDNDDVIDLGGQGGAHQRNRNQQQHQPQIQRNQQNGRNGRHHHHMHYHHHHSFYGHHIQTPPQAAAFVPPPSLRGGNGGRNRQPLERRFSGPRRGRFNFNSGGGEAAANNRNNNNGDWVAADEEERGNEVRSIEEAENNLGALSLNNLAYNSNSSLSSNDEEFLPDPNSNDPNSKNWTDRISGLLFNDKRDLEDVTFKVQVESTPDNQTQEIRFKAHKFILALRSPVFHAMFFGPLAETTHEIEVPDVTPMAFKTMLSFIYKDECELNTLQSTWQLWYAAKKYMLDGLEVKCRRHMQQHLTPLNVLDTYTCAESFGDVQVLYQCLRLIDRNAKYILASAGFAALPAELVKTLVSRNTLNARESTVFESVIRWCQAEVKRQLDDEEHSGTTSSVAELFAEHFERLIRFSAFTSQELVHSVLPHGVITMEKISEISAKIRRREEPGLFTDENAFALALKDSPDSKSQNGSSGGESSGSLLQERKDQQRGGLNQVKSFFDFKNFDGGSLMLLSGPAGEAGQSLLREGNVHSSKNSQLQEQRRFGPGYYQCSRFSPVHELYVAKKWPSVYKLRFKVDKPVYLLGACVTETDRQFYSPKLKYDLRLLDIGNSITVDDGREPQRRVLSEGSETFIKKTSSRIEGGLPKALEYGPHDVTFRNVSYLSKNRWYELELSIGNVETPWSRFPILTCKCFPNVSCFGVNFEFQTDYRFGKRNQKLPQQAAATARIEEQVIEGQQGEAAAVAFVVPEQQGSDSELKGATEGASKTENVDYVKKEDKLNCDTNQENFSFYGLISRLYFYY